MRSVSAGLRVYRHEIIVVQIKPIAPASAGAALLTGEKGGTYGIAEGSLRGYQPSKDQK